MTPSNSMCEVPNYGSSASYCDLPSPEQIRAGVVPLDSLPAAWWNAMWACTNGEVNKARDMLGQLITELNNVLCNAGVCACPSCTDQLYQSIDKIRQTLANATTAGAVKSSSQPSEVAVDANGYMSVNCLGNAASLTTSASTVVGAINELKSTYDCCFTDTATAIGGKAPTSHASSATTYGVGNADNYGHLKISDTYTSVLSTCSGVAASQKAVACVYTVAAAAAAGNVALGNTAGCALGTASAGTATTSARSDHVHALPTKFGTVCSETSTFGTQLMASRSGSSNMASVGFKNCLGILGYIAQNAVDTQFVRYNAAATACYTILDTSKTITIAQGGTGATTAANARTCLGLGSAATCAATAFRSCTWTPTCVACASANGSGTAFGDAATKGVFTRTAVGDIGWGTTANRTKVVDVGAMAYWNGAYQDTASNLRYYCGGAFGSAAACAASCFRASTWWPNSTSCGCVCCSDQAKKAYCVHVSWAHCGCNYRIPFVDCAFACTGIGDKPLAQSVCCCQLLFNPVSGTLSITDVNNAGTGRGSTINAAYFTGKACYAGTACVACCLSPIVNYNGRSNCDGGYVCFSYTSGILCARATSEWPILVSVCNACMQCTMILPNGNFQQVGYCMTSGTSRAIAVNIA